MPDQQLVQSKAKKRTINLEILNIFVVDDGYENYYYQKISMHYYR